MRKYRQFFYRKAPLCGFFYRKAKVIHRFAVFFLPQGAQRLRRGRKGFASFAKGARLHVLGA
jgi:hypothetical protein